MSGYMDAYSVKSLLYSAIFVMLVTVIILFIALVVHKIHVEVRDAHLIKLKEYYSKELQKKLSRRKSNLAVPARKIEFDALTQVLIQMLTDGSISADHAKCLRGYARKLGVTAFYQRMAESRSWVKRSIAIERLGLLGLSEMKPLFYTILNEEKDIGVLSKAVWALSFVADENDLNTIYTMLNRPFFMSAKFSEYIYSNILTSFAQQGAQDLFIDYLKRIKDDSNFSDALKRAIIEACGVRKVVSAKQTIQDYFATFSSAPNMKITCLRALGELGGDEILTVFKLGLNDEDWRVRAVAAKGASSCPQSFIIKDLRDALHDENYHVRINAALSIAQFGDKGYRLLKRAANSDDRFVRDVSNYVLKESSYRV
ncbi:MAG: HEAT repeat domain-containing protein [Candidatus Aquicultor sp.]